MLLERYIDLGILFDRLLHLSDEGYVVKMCSGIIEVGNSGKCGLENTSLTFDSIERALHRYAKPA